MKNLMLRSAVILLLITSNFAQSDIKMQSIYGSENQDILSVLYFEDIGMSKLSFVGKDLIGKDYQNTIKQYVKGKLAKEEVAFDSKESEYFRIKAEKFRFRVMTKITPKNIAKFMFLFNGFSTVKEYEIGDNQKGFAQKDFFGTAKEMSIPLNTNTYIMTYMMPYIKKDGSGAYCEVAQSGVNPEILGTKYAIPTYFLIDIKFQ